MKRGGAGGGGPAKRLLGELEDQVLSSQVSGTPKTTFREREEMGPDYTLGILRWMRVKLPRAFYLSACFYATSFQRRVKVLTA